MTLKGDRLYLEHVRERIERIEEYTREGAGAFRSSSMAQDAVIRSFEVMGEAIKRVSAKLREAHPEIPWRDVAGFRDVLIHDYAGVDVDEVWNIVENDLPRLKEQVAVLLDELGRS